MPDQLDENTTEFSMEELNVWNVENLRKYLRNCGIAIANDTRKPDLFLKVYHASRLHLPLCCTKEQRRCPNCSKKKRKALMTLLMEFRFLLRRNWTIGWREAIIFLTRWWVTWKHTCRKTMTWNPRRREKIYMKADMSLMLSTISYQIALTLLCTTVRGKVVPQTRIGEDPYTNQDNTLFRFSFCPLGTP